MTVRWVVSVKGVVFADDTRRRVLLARNDRDEWELPGGQLELAETPEQCVRREIAEEAGLAVTVGPLLHSWVWEVVPGARLVLLAFGCRLVGAGATPRVSAEHRAIEFRPLDGLAQEPLPAGYRHAIALAATR